MDLAVIDRRGKLTQQPFDVQLTKDSARVHFRGRLVATLTGPVFHDIKQAIDRGNAAEVQLIVARKTGNFKRGNERKG
jgi:hypothetical protein